MLLLDTTGSMAASVSLTSAITRRDLVKEAISTIVERLAIEDSQAEHEEEGGGLMTITFANGTAENLDDLNPQNLRQKWSNIRWGGNTQIMPGWRLLHEVYLEEFGERAPRDRPALLALVITDGEADDITQFSNALMADENAYVVIAIVGFGAEHDRALRSFQHAAMYNKRLKIIPFDSETNPLLVAGSLLEMMSD